MRKFFVSWLICLVAVVAIGAPPDRPDRIILKPKADSAPAAVRRSHTKMGSRIHREFKRIGGLQILELPRGADVAKALAFYRKTGLYEYVEPDRVRHIVTTPNDTYFSSLYGLSKISGPAAWDVRSNAATIVVAVIDTGVLYTHEDLASNMWVNPCLNCPVNGVVYSNDLHGINAITGTGDPLDDNGHGTHTAGTVGALGNNGIGVCGVAWKVQLMALKFLNSSGNGNDSDAIECIEYAIAHGADIMSNSWGGYGDDPALRDAIQAARDAGIIFVAAAGNDNLNIDSNQFVPAGYDLDNIVAVASTDINDVRSSFSNYGRNSVDLGAPGSGIFSTYRSSTNSYATMSGTSMACPHVAGAFALVKAQFPSESYTQLIHRVLGNVDPLPALSNLTVTGGRLNLYKALTQTPRPLADFSAEQADGYSINFLNQTSGDVTNAIWSFGDGVSVTNAVDPSHTYTNAGAYDVSLAVFGPGGSHTQTRSVTVGRNYYLRSTAYNWINPSGMTPLTLSDDSASTGQSLPFSFVLYDQTNSTLYVGSNGLLGFNASNLASPGHISLPNTGDPKGIIAPYWADLNPGVAGNVYIGTIGSAPNRVQVVSWAGVPNFNDNSATLTFQALLYEGSQDIVFQYQEVQATNATYGASRNSTVGIENSTGTIGRQFSYNGSRLLTNNQALLFTLTPPAPTLTSVFPTSPGTNLTPILSGSAVPLATVSLFASGSCGGSPVASGVVDGTGVFNIAAAVGSNSLTIFTAQTIDIFGSNSACSSPINYQHLNAASDLDGDGVSNWSELLAGTDPFSSTSFPRISSALFNGTNVVAVVPSVAGKTYQLQECPTLQSNTWIDVGSPMMGTGAPLNLTDLGVTLDSNRFYRVRITP